jgi:hypothetical protein
MKNRHGRAKPPRRPGERRNGKEDRGWLLPSGESLAEFAMRSGLVAPRLLLAGPSGPEPFHALLRRSAKD